VGSIIAGLLKKNAEDLSKFLFDEDLDYLSEIARNRKAKEITFEDALDVLYRKTNDRRYKEFTSKYFGSWEEVLLSGEFEEVLDVSGFPLYEIAFYHAPTRSKRGNLIGDNSDFIWPYYREFIGSGHRVRSMRELLAKAKKFNLPKGDYENYVRSRRFSDYSETSGFGLGWERFLQGLLKMPYIYSASAFPRVDQIITP
jgi:asparaginyl-tRNA synthetase